MSSVDTGTPQPQPFDFSFTGPIATLDDGFGWIFVVVPDSRELLGTGKAAKVRGTIDGHAFDTALMPLKGVGHFLPLKGALRKLIDKEIGEIVEVRFTERLS